MIQPGPLGPCRQLRRLVVEDLAVDARRGDGEARLGLIVRRHAARRPPPVVALPVGKQQHGAQRRERGAAANL